MPSMDDELAVQSSSIAEDLKLFVNRHPYVREFVDRLHADQPDDRVLFFHGVGGAGKSLLLRYVKQHACKQLTADQWAPIATLEGDAFRTAFDEARAPRVPALLHDFSAAPDKENGDPRQRLDGLLMLRRKLGALEVACPVFDFAVVTYGHSLGYPPEKIASYLPAQETTLVGDLLRVFVTESRVGSIATTAYQHLSRHVGEDARRWWQRRALPAAPLEEILTLEAETELVHRLPQYLAQDINDEMDRRAAKNPRATLCLLFDTHDAFWAEQSGGVSDGDRDEWLRRFLRRVNRTRVQLVFTGRDIPRWGGMSSTPIPDRFVRTVLVGELSPNDANDYLIKRGVQPPARRAQVIDVFGVDGGMHPLTLGLVADLLLRSGEATIDVAKLLDGSSRSFEHVAEGLIVRLLRYLSVDEQYAVTALGCCRSFDADLFFALGDALRFHATDPALRRLTELSFVLPVQGAVESERWKVHTLLRKVFLAQDSPTVQRAHAFLAEHYLHKSQSVGDSDYVEHLYHLSKLEGHDDAVHAWLDALDDVRSRDHEARLRLLALEDDFRLADWRDTVRLANAKAGSLSYQGLLHEAAVVLEAAIAVGGRLDTEDDVLLHAELLLQLGWIRRYRTETELGRSAFTQALEMVASGPAAFDHMAGRLYFGLSGLASDKGDHRECAHVRGLAVEAYESALRRSPDEPMRWLSDASSGMASLADELRELGRVDEARNWALRSVESARRALGMAPEDAPAGANFSYALVVASQALHAAGGPADDALRHASEALTAAREAHERSPDSLMMVRCLLQVARVGGPGELEKSRALVAEAVTIAELQVEFRPLTRAGHLALAHALRVQLDLLGAGDERAAALARARHSCLTALSIAPHYVPAQEMLRDLDGLAGLVTQPP